MANTILTPTQVTRKALAILHNRMAFLRAINRQYDSQFAQSGGKIGSTLKVRMPNQFTVRSGLVMAAQDVTESSQDLVVSSVRGVDVNFDSTELTLSMDDFSARILEPAMARLAAEIEKDVLSNVYKDVWNFSGTAATTPASIAALLNGGVKISQGLAEFENRHIVMDSVTMAALVDAVKALFVPASTVEKAFASGFIGQGQGFKWWQTELVPRHTNGTRTDTTPVVNTSSGITSGTATIAITGFGASATLKKGDVFTVAGVRAINPETKASYDHLQQFVVTADITADGSGNVTPAVSPTPITSGATQTVTIESAGSGKAVVCAGAGGSGAASAVLAQPLAFHRDAFTFVTADLELPKNVEASRQVYDGISLRYVRDFDIVNSKHPARFDVLYGYKTLRPEWACRVRG